MIKNKMLHDWVSIDPIVGEEQKTSSGFLLGSSEEKQMMTKRGRVINAGPDCSKLSSGDIIHYHDGKAQNIRVGEDRLLVTQYKWVVMVEG